jgi:hypothetical protein
MPTPDITSALEAKGPQTGSQLQELTRMEVRALWKACKQEPTIEFEVIGNRYLRLDRSIDGYARLSPSIRREFQTYSVLGLPHQQTQVATMAQRLRDEIEQISRAKLDLARDAIQTVTASLPDWQKWQDAVCFVIAGDVVYSMAHNVPRPESSTGELVRGSDLDIVVITDDAIDPAHVRALDQAIYRQKHFLLMNPSYREEIDYLIKDLAKVRQQVRFDTFEHMVACKIIREGELLGGSQRVFEEVKRLLDEHGVPARLDEMERVAAARRHEAEQILLDPPENLDNRDVLTLFYTKEESEEIF